MKPLRRPRCYTLAALSALTVLHGNVTYSAEYQKLRYEDQYAQCEPEKACLGLGGEGRWRYEGTNNIPAGNGQQTGDAVFLQRYLLHADYRREHLRAFAQLRSGIASGRSVGAAPVDEGKLEIQQGFLDLGRADTFLRLGRAEVSLGSERLVAVADGLTIRRRFDGAQVLINRGKHQSTIFGLHPVNNDLEGRFSDSTDQNRGMWGLYTVSDLGLTSLDSYYIGFSNDNAVFDSVQGHETRHSLGARMHGNRGSWRWNWEALVQWGDIDGQDIRAWTFATDTVYSPGGNANLGLIVNTNVASGDRDPNDDTLETFNPLFPRGNYFSNIGLLGPQNFANIHPGIEWTPGPVWSAALSIDFFWRLENTDGVYTPPGFPLGSGNASDARYVATLYSGSVRWQINRNWHWEAVYSIGNPGPYLEDIGYQDLIHYGELTIGYRFKY
ncbi:MAG: alginate export family protein [Pseudomonadota bacterium]